MPAVSLRLNGIIETSERLRGLLANKSLEEFETGWQKTVAHRARHRDHIGSQCGVSQLPTTFAAGSHRQLRDISHTRSLFLLVSLCLRIAVRARCKLGGNSETGH